MKKRWVVPHNDYHGLNGSVTQARRLQTRSASPAAMAGECSCQRPSASFSDSVRTGQQKL